MQEVRYKYTILKYLINQYDALTGEFASKLYGAALTCSNMRFRAVVDQYRQQYEESEVQMRAAEATILQLTQMKSIEEVRAAYRELDTVLTAYDEVQRELISRQQLNQSLRDVIERHPETNPTPEGELSALEKVDRSTAEIPELAEHAELLAEQAQYLADSVRLLGPGEQSFTEVSSTSIEVVRG